MFFNVNTLQGITQVQQSRAFAEKAVAAEIDWDAISGAIHSDEGKRELASLRSTFFDVQNRLHGMAKVRTDLDITLTAPTTTLTTSIQCWRPYLEP